MQLGCDSALCVAPLSFCRPSSAARLNTASFAPSPCQAGGGWEGVITYRARRFFARPTNFDVQPANNAGSLLIAHGERHRGIGRTRPHDRAGLVITRLQGNGVIAAGRAAVTI